MQAKVIVLERDNFIFKNFNDSINECIAMAEKNKFFLANITYLQNRKGILMTVILEFRKQKDEEDKSENRNINKN